MANEPVSIVIPAYNEGDRLPAFLADLARAEEARLPFPVEFIVVDDGSSQQHLSRHAEAVEVAQATLARRGLPHRFRLVRAERNGGKGAAIRLGWREADPSSEWLGFVDADGAIPATEVWRLASMLDGKRFEMLAGARIRMAGHRIHRSLLRHLQGRVFATLVEHAIPNGFYDTQCGLKLVKADLVRRNLDRLVESRWLLDVELIAVVRGENGRCIEEPIDWRDPGGSKVRPLVDPLRMLLGIWRLRRRQFPRRVA